MIARRTTYPLILLILAMLLVSTNPARAQEPTPEPTLTPTPTYLRGVPLSNGSELIIHKEITYGEVAVVVAVFILAAVVLVSKFIEIPRMWFR